PVGEPSSPARYLKTMLFSVSSTLGLAAKATRKQVLSEGHGSPAKGVEVTRPKPTVNKGRRARPIWAEFSWSKPFGPIWAIDVGMVRVPCGDPVIRLLGSLLLLKLA